MCLIREKRDQVILIFTAQISDFIPLGDFFNSVPDTQPSLTFLNVISDEVALLLGTR